MSIRTMHLKIRFTYNLQTCDVLHKKIRFAVLKFDLGHCHQTVVRSAAQAMVQFYRKCISMRITTQDVPDSWQT